MEDARDLGGGTHRAGRVARIARSRPGRRGSRALMPAVSCTIFDAGWRSAAARAGSRAIDLLTGRDGPGARSRSSTPSTRFPRRIRSPFRARRPGLPAGRRSFGASSMRRSKSWRRTPSQRPRGGRISSTIGRSIAASVDGPALPRASRRIRAAAFSRGHLAGAVRPRPADLSGATSSKRARASSEIAPLPGEGFGCDSHP